MRVILHQIEGAKVDSFDYAVNGQVLDITYHGLIHRLDFTDLSDGVLLNPPDFDGCRPLIWAKKYQGDLMIGLMSLSEEDALDEPFDPKETELADDFEIVLIDWSTDEPKKHIPTEAEKLAKEFEAFKKELEEKYNLLERALISEHDIEIEE